MRNSICHFLALDTIPRLMRYAKRIDVNQPEIVQAFRKLGCSVLHLHMVGQGCPDILVGYGGICGLVEIKTETGKLKKTQTDFLDDWTGGAYVVRNDEDVNRIVEMLKRWHAAITKASLDAKHEWCEACAKDITGFHYCFTCYKTLEAQLESK